MENEQKEYLNILDSSTNVLSACQEEFTKVNERNKEFIDGEEKLFSELMSEAGQIPYGLFNISGKIFQFTKKELFDTKDSGFYYIGTERFEENTVYIFRENRLFYIIELFIKRKNEDLIREELEKGNSESIQDLMIECEYYEIKELKDMVSRFKGGIR